MNSSVFHLAEVVRCSPASFFPCLLEGLCGVGGEMIWLGGERGEKWKICSLQQLFFRYFNVFICKILMEWSWKNYACCSWHFMILLHAVWRTCCLSQKLWNRMEIDLGCSPVSFLKPYILWALPFFLWFPLPALLPCSFAMTFVGPGISLSHFFYMRWIYGSIWT